MRARMGGRPANGTQTTLVREGRKIVATPAGVQETYRGGRARERSDGRLRYPAFGIGTRSPRNVGRLRSRCLRVHSSASELCHISHAVLREASGGPDVQRERLRLFPSTGTGRGTAFHRGDSTRNGSKSGGNSPRQLTERTLLLYPALSRVPVQIPPPSLTYSRLPLSSLALSSAHTVADWRHGRPLDKHRSGRPPALRRRPNTRSDYGRRCETC